MDELKQLLTGDVVSNITNNINELLELIPEIKPSIGFEQKHPHHHLDVWGHTLYALSLSEDDFEIRLALLLHDVGKPFSYQDEEVRHFHGHADVSTMMSADILNRLGFDKASISRLCFLIKNHDIAITEEQVKNNYELALKLYEVQRCDALAHHPDVLEKRKQYLNDTKVKILKLGD